MVSTCFASFVPLLIIFSRFIIISNCDCEAQLDMIQQRLETLQSKFLMLEKQLNDLEFSVNANISVVTKQIRQGLDSSASCYEGKTSSSLINLKASHNSKSVATFCDMNTKSGGWIVVQQRVDSLVSFKRGWNEYRNGFGNPTTNFWIGLENLYQLTSMDRYELFIELQFSNGSRGNAQYSEFRVGSEKERYALVRLGSFSGTVYDAMRAHRGCNFSTFDRWNVEGYTGGMTWAQTDQGGWWYYSSYESQLNSGIGTSRGIYWQSSHLKLSRMMIR